MFQSAPHKRGGGGGGGVKFGSLCGDVGPKLTK